MSFRKLVLCSSMLAAGSLVAQPQAVSTTAITVNQSYTFPPVGVASNETLEVNLANTATAPASTTTSTAPSCTGTVTLTNASGAAIGKANPFTVGAGAIQSITIPYGNLGVSGSARAEVLVTVQRSVTVPSTAACNLMDSLETYLTTTGETHVLLAGNALVGEIVPVLGTVLTPVAPGGNGGH